MSVTMNVLQLKLFCCDASNIQSTYVSITSSTVDKQGLESVLKVKFLYFNKIKLNVVLRGT